MRHWNDGESRRQTATPHILDECASPRLYGSLRGSRRPTGPLLDELHGGPDSVSAAAGSLRQASPFPTEPLPVPRGRPAACAAFPFCRGCSASSTVATLPLRLLSVDTRLLSAALFAGPQPLRILLSSSSKLTSRERWFPVSAVQCLRRSVSSRHADA